MTHLKTLMCGYFKKPGGNFTTVVAYWNGTAKTFPSVYQQPLRLWKKQCTIKKPYKIATRNEKNIFEMFKGHGYYTNRWDGGDFFEVPKIPFFWNWHETFLPMFLSGFEGKKLVSTPQNMIFGFWLLYSHQDFIQFLLGGLVFEILTI